VPTTTREKDKTGGVRQKTQGEEKQMGLQTIGLKRRLERKWTCPGESQTPGEKKTPELGIPKNAETD